MDIKTPSESLDMDEHEHAHIVTIRGKKQQYFSLLEALENEEVRRKFLEDPQPLLKKHGIEFPDITSKVVKDNLPDPAQLRQFRTAYEEESAEYAKNKVHRSHAHLVWDLITGQSALTRKHKKAH